MATFKQWESILHGKKITEEDVLTAIKEFQEKILSQLDDSSLGNKQKDYLLAQLSVVRFIVKTVESPKLDVRRVEQEVENLTGR